ncbi:hypothetical protein M9H77_19287 [Catharanthus roseus]|uniref:Uncharacterized protein n=1 Tax=Catharanthus roseus TaxID=4058 RepID=A0ACC0B9W4_CATRO|nr:hypothetical protein M9H77_19287 [Catharanthus roseus]
MNPWKKRLKLWKHYFLGMVKYCFLAFLLLYALSIIRDGPFITKSDVLSQIVMMIQQPQEKLLPCKKLLHKWPRRCTTEKNWLPVLLRCHLQNLVPGQVFKKQANVESHHDYKCIVLEIQQKIINDLEPLVTYEQPYAWKQPWGNPKADTAFHAEYKGKEKEGLTLLPYVEWVRNETLTFHVYRLPQYDGETFEKMGYISEKKDKQNEDIITVFTVEAFDFTEWFQRTVTKRGYVVVKIDVEGSEVKSLTRLSERGALCLIDEFFSWNAIMNVLVLIIPKPQKRRMVLAWVFQKKFGSSKLRCFQEKRGNLETEKTHNAAEQGREDIAQRCPRWCRRGVHRGDGFALGWWQG